MAHRRTLCRSLAALATCLAVRGLVGGRSGAREARWQGLAAALVAAAAWRLADAPARRLLGRRSSRSPVEMRRTVHVAAPVERVFASWSEARNLPHLLARTAGVRVGRDDVAPAEITRFEPDRLLAWRSRPEASVAHAGVARFLPEPGGGTRLELRVSWEPPRRHAA
jgi:uncharacterized membrane protein